MYLAYSTSAYSIAQSLFVTIVSLWIKRYVTLFVAAYFAILVLFWIWITHMLYAYIGIGHQLTGVK